MPGHRNGGVGPVCGKFDRLRIVAVPGIAPGSLEFGVLRKFHHERRGF